MSLIEFRAKGIYCPEGDFYVDPWRSVKKALITHGHSDHARHGHQNYISAQSSVPILKHRLGRAINLKGIKYGERISINGVTVSFHPAGHIIGSSQIRIEKKGEVWVISGDYKIVDDGISEAFEPVRCHHFITETTFALPIYNWPDQGEVFQQINEWWSKNKAEKKASIIAAYSLGKAQRILQGVDDSIGKIYTHGAIENTNKALIASGVKLRPTMKIEDNMAFSKFEGALIIAPPSSLGSGWMNRFKQTSTGIASGWMALRGMRRRRSSDRGFILSDHVDWPGINKVIEEIGAEHIYPTHGYTSIFSKWLEEKGYQVKEVKTEFEGEQLESSPE